MTTFPEPVKSMKPAIIKCMSSPDKSVINCTGVPIQPSNGVLVPVTVPDQVTTRALLMAGRARSMARQQLKLTIVLNIFAFNNQAGCYARKKSHFSKIRQHCIVRFDCNR